MTNRHIIIALLVIASFLVGIEAGIEITENTYYNQCEQRVVTSIMEGRPFTFINGQPYTVYRKLQKGTIYYRAMQFSEYEDNK